jgi:hypothetical protein
MTVGGVMSATNTIVLDDVIKTDAFIADYATALGWDCSPSAPMAQIRCCDLSSVLVSSYEDETNIGLKVAIGRIKRKHWRAEIKTAG